MAPAHSTDMPVWIRKADKADLNLLKNLLGLRNGKTPSTPDVIGEAIRIALADLKRTSGSPRQEPAEGPVYGPFTAPRITGDRFDPIKDKIRPAGTTPIGPSTVGDPEDDLKVIMPDGSTKLLKRKHLVSGPVIGIPTFNDLRDPPREDTP